MKQRKQQQQNHYKTERHKGKIPLHLCYLFFLFTHLAYSLVSTNNGSIARQVGQSCFHSSPHTLSS